MRRFVFEDKKHEVKVTIDLPEELHTQIKRNKAPMEEAILKLVNFTIENGEANE